MRLWIGSVFADMAPVEKEKIEKNEEFDPG